MKFVVGGLGWFTNNRLVAAGTVIDTGNQPGPQIPMDAVPLDLATFYYMTSWGVAGMGYPMDSISTRFVPVSPTFTYHPPPPP
jgi:hypothetical protein